MSYILEALKKSERERRQVELKAIERISFEEAKTETQNAPFKLIGAMFCATAIGALLAWQFGFISSPDRAPSALEGALSSTDAQQTRRAVQQRESTRQIDQRSVDATNQGARTRITTGEQTALFPAAALGTSDVDPTAPVQTAAEVAAPGQLPREPLYDQLPAQIRSELAKPEISAQVYSPENVAARFVISDGRFTRQGERVGSSALMVEEIRESEVVFRYRDSLFRVVIEQ